MAFNALMHPRNLYKDNPPNFKELAAKYSEFKKFCTVDLQGKITIDFKNPETVRALTRALLKNDFDLDVELPSDSLVPRIPLRLNYILWLQDMVEQISGEKKNEEESWGLDIGTGASCIYPLLGAKSAGWHFKATERDAVSVDVARRNVERNGLRHLIEVIKVDEQTALCGVADAVDERTFDFCMCNPPFYDISGELTYCASAGRPGRPEPHSATVAKTNEVCAEGGEVGFVSRMIDDSIKLRNRVRIYTSMIGKKASLGPLKAKLRESKVADMCVTTFCQGKTQRWALAWTFLDDLKLKPNNQTGIKKKRAPLLYEVPPVAVRPYTFEKVVERVLEFLRDLEITYTETESSQRSLLSRFVRYSAEAKRNTWLHNRRKRRAMNRSDKEPNEKTSKVEGKNAGVSCSAGSKAEYKGSNEKTSKLEDKEVDGETFSTDMKADIRNWAESRVDFFQTEKKQSLQISNSKNGAGKEEPKLDGASVVVSKCLLSFDLTVKSWDTKIVLELQFVDGENPDALHQILQFMKNRFH